MRLRYQKAEEEGHEACMLQSMFEVEYSVRGQIADSRRVFLSLFSGRSSFDKHSHTTAATRMRQLGNDSKQLSIKYQLHQEIQVDMASDSDQTLEWPIVPDDVCCLALAPGQILLRNFHCNLGGWGPPTVWIE